MSALVDTVQACAVALLSGAVLHASDVTAGNGSVIDWREVKSGATLLEGGNAFDVAYLFVTVVGWYAAMLSLDPDSHAGTATAS